MARKRISSSPSAPPLVQGGGEAPVDAGDAAAFVDVTLLRPHTHAGVAYAAGDVLNVSPATARWLLEREVASVPLPARPEPDECGDAERAEHEADGEDTGDRPRP